MSISVTAPTAKSNAETIRLCATSYLSTRPSALPISTWSGSTRPCTIASPHPQLVSTTMRSVLPVTGCTENATPDARAWISSMTPTAIGIAWWLMPLRSR